MTLLTVICRDYLFKSDEEHKGCALKVKGTESVDRML